MSKSEIRGPKSTIESFVKTLKAEKFEEESNIELFEAIYEAVERVADEITIEEIVINSNIETIIDKIARGEAVRDNTARAIVAVRGKTAEEGEAIPDKIAGGEAVYDNTADAIVAGGDKIAEKVVELLVDQPIEAIREAVDWVGEEANEIIVIDSITETIIDKIAEKVAKFLVDQPIEAIREAVDRVD